MHRGLHIFALIGLSLLILGADARWARGETTKELLREYVERIRGFDTVMIEGERIASVIVLPRLYEQENFRLLWTNPTTVSQLLQAIQEIEQDGLEPRDYHWTVLQRLRPQVSASATPEPARLVHVDLLLTDALIRLGYHLLFGKADPEALDVNWNAARDLGDLDPVQMIQGALRDKAVAQLIAELRPKHVYYARLQAALAQYRAIQAHGGWKPVPAGPTLKLGMTAPRVLAVQERLMATGDLQEGASEPMVFDTALAEGVKHFQRRHGLEVDGMVGRNTLEAMNVPVADRIDQIRVNLERARWVLHETAGQFVVVDIAGFRVLYVDDDEVVWTTRAQVGRPYRKTPVFKSAITYLVLNPTWTVPPGILTQDVLPAVRRDRSYLQKHNLQVIDARGNRLDPRILDWSKYTGRSFPYQLRQEPGPANALGRIKFMFPNPHLVYLHDTPSQELFDKPERPFSSGCIRIEKPLELAELLLNEPTRWSREQIAQAIDTKATRTVFLETPVPVLLLYWTVDVSRDGVVAFRRDIYERDRAVLTALNGEFRFRKRPILPNPAPSETSMR